ncbi:MAG: asparaginase [Acidimicrobiia bacterium]
MRFARVRSGLRETSHEVIGYATDESGNVLFSSGDVDRPLFYRSAVKPFQALAGQRLGLRLPDEHLAVTCASHAGYPVHLATVKQVLADNHLDVAHLQCPPARPETESAAGIQTALGRSTPRRIFHNCSGKHAGWLAACAVAGYDTNSYLDPQHPLQQTNLDVVADVTGIDPGPVGIDGCGGPTPQGSVVGLATAFSTLTTDPEFDRIARAITRFGPLTSDNIASYGRISANWGGPSKGGAEGLFAMSRHGLSIATKSLEGSVDIAVAAAIEIAVALDALPRGTSDWLEDVRHPPVLGGGLRQGSLELVSL